MVLDWIKKWNIFVCLFKNYNMKTKLTLNLIKKIGFTKSDFELSDMSDTYILPIDSNCMLKIYSDRAYKDPNKIFHLCIEESKIQEVSNTQRVLNVEDIFKFMVEYYLQKGKKSKIIEIKNLLEI